MWEFDQSCHLNIFWSDLHDPFMYIIIVYLVFISSIAKGLAMSRLGGEGWFRCRLDLARVSRQANIFLFFFIFFKDSLSFYKVSQHY